jgi:hypothetical protein
MREGNEQAAAQLVGQRTPRADDLV